MEVNKIYCEDCLETMRKMQTETIDMTCTSPPYDSLRTYNGYSFKFESIANELFRVTKQGGVVVWVVGDSTKNGSESGTSFEQALYFKKVGFNIHDTMIYLKNNFSNPANTRYHQVFEYMFVLSKGKRKTFNPIKDRKNIYIGQKSHGKRRTVDGWEENTSGQTTGEFGMRHNVWKYVTAGGVMAKDKIAHKHPAIFPEKLAEDHILSWSAIGDIIYDPMAGSGTVPKMAILNKRSYIASEISKEYCDLIDERLSLIHL